MTDASDNCFRLQKIKEVAMQTVVSIRITVIRKMVVPLRILIHMMDVLKRIFISKTVGGIFAG